MKQSYLLFTLFFIFACTGENRVSSKALPDGYESSVNGLFLDGSDQEYCQISAELKGITASEFLDYSWKNRNHLDFLTTGIRSSISGIMVSVSSAEFCKGPIEETLKDKFNGKFELQVIEGPKEFKKFRTESVLRDHNLFDIKLDFSEIRPYCAIIRKKELNLELEDNLTIRYRLAIPILYYNFSDDREIIYFDDQCKNKSIFLNLIDKYYK
ncbi:MAG: hypothetical protein ABJO01_09880 [Parasphingorhabdus sp.]|uniref:hypothetical protein n=1 Tax=Parasphingorhabdus sp. TaxID=2709688 RepID=UPI003298B3AA